jgi:hypothetical protein
MLHVEWQTRRGSIYYYDVITLPAMSSRAFELILECLYTGVLGQIDASNVMELLEVSKRLQVGLAEAQCFKWLEEHLDASSALLVWESARRFECEAVKLKAWPVVGRHLREIARQEAFLKLPLPLLVELVSNDALRYPSLRSEETVFEAVMGWVRRDEAGRKGTIHKVLGALRLGLLPAAFLAENVAAHPLIEPSLDASRLVAAVIDGSANPSRVGIASSAALNRRSPPADGVGTDAGQVVLATVEPNNQGTGWEVLPNMHFARFGCAAACVDELLYVMGGKYTWSNPLARVECYDPSTQQWQAIPDMTCDRYACAAACIDGLLYVMGGEDAAGCNLARAECYNPKTRRWRALPDMKVARYGCAAASMDGILYVVGGEAAGSDSSIASAECYDPLTDSWCALPDMIVKRRGCAAGAIDGVLYVMGGVDAGNTLASVECYDPRTGHWRGVPHMSSDRYGCAAACIDGLLYVVGGLDDSNNTLASAECYDPATRQWRVLPNMSSERLCCAAAFVAGCMYVVGGDDNAGNALASAECLRAS